MRDNGASSPYYRIWSYIAYLSCCCLILIPVAALIFLVDPNNARSLGSSGLIFLFVLMVTGSFCLAAGTVRCLACTPHTPTSPREPTARAQILCSFMLCLTQMSRPKRKPLTADEVFAALDKFVNLPAVKGIVITHDPKFLLVKFV